MSPWWTAAQDRIALGRACVLVTVASVEGSAPREAGAKMLVWETGQSGTVGGGKLEFTIVEQARRMLEAATPWRLQHYPLGPLLGQCCGGRVGILLERLDAQGAAWLGELAKAEESGQAYQIVSKPQANAIHKAVVAGGGGQGVVISAAQSVISGHIGEGFIIAEHIDPRPRLFLFGAGHIGQAVHPIAASLGFHLTWFDSRSDFASAGVTLVADMESQIRDAPPGSYYLIFSHSHDLDYRLTRAVLQRGDFAYCGLIGSATKRARFERRLLGDGVAPANLGRLTCPIGAIGLASKLPQEMAVAIAAELLLVRQQVAAVAERPSEMAAHGH